MYLGDSVLNHWTRTQDRVARSSGEAELKATCCGYDELLGLFELARFLRPGPWTLEHRVDASATYGILHRQGAGSMKHLSIRELCTQQARTEYGIDVQKIARHDNAADALASPATVADGLEHKMRCMQLHILNV